MARSKETARGDAAVLGEARRKEIDEEKKAKVREARAWPKQRAADRLVQKNYSAKHRMHNRLNILVAEDARRHSDPDKPRVQSVLKLPDVLRIPCGKRRRVARLKRIHDYPHEDYHQYQEFNQAKQAKKEKARLDAKLPKRGKNGSGEEEEEDDLDESDGELDELASSEE
ncbi:hypothetical protein BDZ89DRAFT_1051641 [Hymenopellis radicata]|nr:hypothetical protein BDZ89DRAFT_1051641 [Hymenopellis radicata]